MANTPSTAERPSETGYYLCEVRRWHTGAWVAAETVLYWDGRTWWLDSLHTEDFDGIYSFRGPLTIDGVKPTGRRTSFREVQYSQ